MHRSLALLLSFVLLAFVWTSWSSVAAECEGSAAGPGLCIEPAIASGVDYCVPEQTTVTSSATISVTEDYDSRYFPTRFDVGLESGSMTGLPFEQCVNTFTCGEFPGAGAPTQKSVTLPFSFTTPTVTHANFNTVLTLSFHGTSFPYDSDWIDEQFDITGDAIQREVIIAHVNTDGVVEPSPTTQTVVVANRLETASADITFTSVDDENNDYDYELERDTTQAFSSIDQTISNTAAANTVIEQGFGTLAVGTHYWRVRTSEINLPDYCQVNLQQGGQSAIASLRKPIKKLGFKKKSTTAAVSPTSTVIVRTDTRFNAVLFYDENQNNSQDPGEDTLPNITATLVDSLGSQTITTDSNGQFLVDVEPGTVSFALNTNDPDIPDGYQYNGASQFTIADSSDTNPGSLAMIASSQGSTPTPQATLSDTGDNYTLLMIVVSVGLLVSGMGLLSLRRTELR